LEASPSSAATPAKPLQGLRLVVTGLDLQQQEHRGIAAYSKALLKALACSGAELWLLTDFEPKLSGGSLRRAPAGAKQLVFSARVLEALNRGHQAAPLPLAATVLARRSAWAKKVVKAWRLVQELPGYLLLRGRYRLRRAKRVDLLSLFDNPYVRLERLRYFEDLTGILCARNLYINSFRAAAGRHSQPIAVELEPFDGLISTCPLHLRTCGNGPFIQTIHDLIPLEYMQTTDHAGAFSRRLESCLATGRLFVSSSTQRKFKATFGEASGTGEAVLIQPPSLQLPEPHQWSLADQNLLRPSPRLKGELGNLQAFRYVLFNSSVEPRKNLLFVIRAYRRSGLAEHGIRLCVTGQLKKDDYSRSVAEQADESVLLTGYIDEPTKALLFLNALMVLSPSLVEGFGIPVLDAACLGAGVIASPSESHREIQAMHDFQSLVWLCDTRDPLDWAIAMQRLAAEESTRIGQSSGSGSGERQRRLRRYRHQKDQVFEAFRGAVCQQVMAELARSKREEPGAHG
jgi:glycosyltransferase involved in cell wall biosynthesis